MPVDQTKVWDTRSHAVQPGGEEDSSGQNDSIHKVCLCFFTFLNTPVINCTSMQSCCRGSLGVRGGLFWATRWSSSTTTCSQVWGVSPEEVVFRETIRSGRLRIAHPGAQDHHRHVQSERSGERDHGDVSQVNSVTTSYLITFISKLGRHFF